ncbi:MAG: hypothetical protein KDA22_09790 [Phycisphaerales bacterium]|nr:hypothetical protein [Phycisphaerales bacterium]
MSPFTVIYRKLDRLQQRRGVRILLSIVAAAACLGVFLPLAQSASSLQSQRQALAKAMADQNINRRDPQAVSIKESGIVTVNGRDYGGEQIKRLADVVFDPSGDLVAVDRLIEIMLADQVPGWAPQFLLEQPRTVILVMALCLVWLEAIIWLGLSVPFAGTVLGTALAGLPFFLWGSIGGLVSVAGIGLLTFTFVLLVRLLLMALRWPAQPIAVAHTLVKEATRLNISLAFIVLLLLALPLIPLWIDPSQPLRYQLQTFISRSLNLTFVLAACMTLLLSCATVAFEIRDRQIWQLMTKPVSRLGYLFGKFLGVVLLDLLLLVIAGVSIFLFVQYLRTRPTSDILDAQAVQAEVLTARAGAFPEYTRLNREQLIATVDEEIRNDPVLEKEIDDGVRNEREVKRELAVKAQVEYLRKQRVIPPGEKRTFTFRGLGPAKRSAVPLTLRYMFYAGRSDSHEKLPVVFDFGEVAIQRLFVPVQAHVLTVSPEVIRDDGTVELSIYNVYFEGDQTFAGPYDINFDAKDFELLYRVSDFESNFLRAMIVQWLRLAFLAMLGVAAATFLSFPVACILSFSIFLIASMAPFLAESLEYWSADDAARGAVLIIASASEWLLRSFSSVRPTQLLVEGRLVSWGAVIRTLLVLGLAWSGLALVIGYLAFRRKELAIYSGQG